MNSYKIVRHYFKGGKRVIESGLSLEEAKAHCSSPNSSSNTAHGKDSYTKKVGPWFDGFYNQSK